MNSKKQSQWLKAAKNKKLRLLAVHLRSYRQVGVNFTFCGLAEERDCIFRMKSTNQPSLVL